MLSGANLFSKTLQDYADKNIGKDIIRVSVHDESPDVDDELYSLYEIRINGNVYSNFMSCQEVDSTVRNLVDGFNLAKKGGKLN